MSNLKNWLSGSVLVYAQIGDMDACASFVALSELFKKLKTKAELEFSTGVLNKDGAKILKLFNLKVKSFEEAVECNIEKVILVDTQPNLLPKQFSKLDVFVIDHHQPSAELKKVKNLMHDSSAASTTEIIFDLFGENKMNITKEASKAILYGIIADTAGLRFAKTKTFKIISELLEENKLDYQELLSEISEERDYSEKIACLKAAKRLEIKTFGQKILVITEIGGFESSAASRLMSFGPDVVLVVSKKQDETRIVGRAKKEFNLAEIFQKVGKEIEATAGGHAGAAVINFDPKKEKEALAKIVKLITGN